MNVRYDDNTGLVPAIIQDVNTKEVLMLGYMNEEALSKTKKSGRVTFFSRSKGRLWTKGESSGNFLELKSIRVDCDNDTILIEANPLGPTCHRNTISCFDTENSTKSNGMLYKLERIISERIASASDNSYTNRLVKKGINKVAQKVGEEAVELVIEAKDNNKELFLNEAADLFYHYTVLIAAKGYSLSDVEDVLFQRNVE